MRDEITDYRYYHGTVLHNANKIKHQGFWMSDEIGSLGKGAYAFCESELDAEHFAWKVFHGLQKKSNYHLDMHK